MGSREITENHEPKPEAATGTVAIVVLPHRPTTSTAPRASQSSETTNHNASDPATGIAVAIIAAPLLQPDSHPAPWNRETFNGGLLPLPRLMDQSEYHLALPQKKCLVVGTIGPANAGKSHILLNLSEAASANKPLRPAFNSPDEGGFGFRYVDPPMANVVWMDSYLRRSSNSADPTSSRSAEKSSQAPPQTADTNVPLLSDSAFETLSQSAEKIALDVSKVLLLVVSSKEMAVEEMERLNERVSGAQECFVIHNYIKGPVPTTIADRGVAQALELLAPHDRAFGQVIAEVRGGVVVLRHNRNDRFRHFFTSKLMRGEDDANAATFVEMRKIIASYLPSAFPVPLFAAAVNKAVIEMMECTKGEPISPNPSVVAAKGTDLVVRTDTLLQGYNASSIRKLAEGMPVSGYQVRSCRAGKKPTHDAFGGEGDAHTLSFDIVCPDEAARQSVEEQLQWDGGIFLKKPTQTVSLRVVGRQGQLVQHDTDWDEYQVGGADAEPVVKFTQPSAAKSTTVTVYFAPQNT